MHLLGISDIFPTEVEAVRSYSLPMDWGSEENE